MARPEPAPTRLRATDPTDWSSLMIGAQAGDTAAYRRLLDGVTPLLRAVARRSLRKAADVEDAVQDILLTVHTVRHTYDPARPFRPWLLGIAQHRIVDRLRARGRIAAREVPLVVDHEAVADDSLATNAADYCALHGSLAALPHRQREALTLLKLQEMSLVEASAASGRSIGALKVATHRDQQALRRLLGHDGLP